MKKIAIVYYSATGNTQALAEAIQEGVLSAGGSAKLITASLFGPDMVDSYDALALGCPASGAENLEEDVFEPMYEAIKPHLTNKKLALFGSYGWGDGLWMRNWEEDALASGATLVGESLIAEDDPDETALEAAKALGRTLAE